MRLLGYHVDDVDHGEGIKERFERGFTACDPDGNGLDLDEFRTFVLTVAPDAAVRVELVLGKGCVCTTLRPSDRCYGTAHRRERA